MRLLAAIPLVVVGRGGERIVSAQAPAPGRLFGSDAGMILNTIKPDKTADFEMVMDKVKQALQTSSNAQRRDQANGWRVFKVLEPGPNNTVLYVFWMNPAVKGADYTISMILNEAFPTEVQALYKTFSDAYAGGQSLMNLQLIGDMKPTV
jgi:hypothetical protein